MFGDHLHTGRSGADHADALAGQVGEVLAGELAIPAAGVEHLPGESENPWHCRQSRFVLVTCGQDEVPGTNLVSAVGRHDPLGPALISGHLGRRRLKKCAVVQAVVPADRPEVVEDFWLVRVLLARNKAELLQEWQVDIRLRVALRTGVAVPVPGAAEVSPLLDHPDRVDAGIPQARTGDETAAADDDDLDGLFDWVPGEIWIRIVVALKARLRPSRVDELLVALVTNPLLSLAAVGFARCFQVVGAHPLREPHYPQPMILNIALIGWSM